MQIHHNKDIKLFCEDLVDIALKTGWYVGKAEGHYLVLEVAISGAKGRLPFVTFLYPYLMISTSQV